MHFRIASASPIRLLSAMTSQPIIAGLDFSEGSGAALVRAADLAERFHVRLHLVHARPTVQVHTDFGGAAPEVADGSLEGRVRDFARRALGGAEAFDEVHPEIVVRHSEAASDALVHYAEEVEAGLIVMGTHGRRGVRHFLMGSVAEEVVRLAPCPVLTVPDAAARTAPGPDAPVLVPVDFSDANAEALTAARLVADQFRAPVELVHVVEEPGPYPSVYDDVQGLLPMIVPVFATARGGRTAGQLTEHLQRFGEEQGLESPRCHVRYGQPAHEILAVAEESQAGLIVMATEGLKGLQHALLGSVTERTLRRAPCPVLSVRSALVHGDG